MQLDFFKGKNSAGTAYSLFICIFLVIGFLGQTILRYFTSEISFTYKIIRSLFSSIAFVLACVLLTKKKDLNFTITVGLKKFKIYSLALTLFIAFGMYYGLGLVNIELSKFVDNIGLNVIQSNIKPQSIFELVCYIVSVGVITAIAEEMFFRGLLNNLLDGTNFIKRVLFTSICFALYHSNISQLIYQFIYGVFLALLYEYSKSIIPCAIAHLLNNGFILITLYYNVDLAHLSYSPYMIVGGVLSLILVATFISKKVKLKGNDNGESIKGAYLYAVYGLIVTILTIILNLVGR